VLLSVKDVLALTGLSRTTLWRLRKAGQFPQPVPAKFKRFGWDRETIELWLKERTSRALAK